MIIRFCLYSILKNLRFFDPFLAIYLLTGILAFGIPSGPREHETCDALSTSEA